MARAKVITPEQQAEILYSLEEQCVPLEIIVMYLLLRDTGLRISEAICLRFGVFWGDGKIASVVTLPGKLRKGHRGAADVTITLSPLFRGVLQKYANRRAEENTFGACEFLFPGRSGSRVGHVHRATAAKRLKKIFVAALGTDVAQGMTTHSLRRSLATLLHRLGTKIELIKIILGHKQIETTLRYIEFSEDQVTSQCRRAHAHLRQVQAGHHVKGLWRRRGPRLFQPTFFEANVGYPDQMDVFCTNDEAAQGLLKSIEARLMSTRCKPQRPRRRRSSSFWGSSD